MKFKVLAALFLGLTACNSEETKTTKKIEKPEEKVIVTKEEIKDENTNKVEIQENTKEDVNLKQTPKLAFSNNGIILPKLNDNKIAFRTRNINRVRVKLRQIFFNNTTQFLQTFRFSGNGNLYNYYVRNSLGRVSDIIINKKFDVKNIEDKWVQNQIDLSNFVGEKGMYAIEISFDEDDTNYVFPRKVPYWKKQNYFENNGQITKAIMITDMGILAQKEKNNNLTVNILNVMKNSLLKNVSVKAISYTNQIMDEKKTNKNGEVKFDNADKIFYILAEREGEMSVLKLKDNKLSYDGFNVGGIKNIGKTKAFIYSNRGVYRPGDKICLGIIARNEDGSFPKDQPIKINVFTPRGDKFIEDKVIHSDKDGFFTFDFETKDSSQTGIWQAQINVSGKNFNINLPIETIVPHKIEVSESFPDSIKISKDMKIVGEVKSKYLFGSPASNLKFNSEITIKPKKIRFKEYKNFTFNNPTSYVINLHSYTKGNLDEKGYGKIKFSDIPNLPTNMTLTGNILTRVIQNSGRPVIKTENVIINPLKSYVGISQSDFVKTGENLNLEVVNLNEDGKQVAGDKIKYRIYRNEYSWWWDYYGYDDFIKSIKKDKNTKLLYEGSFTSSDKPYLLDYNIEKSGEIFVEVENLSTHQTAGTSIYSSSWLDADNMKVVDRLRIKTDKKSYQYNDVAHVSFEGAKNTKALVTISSDGRILKRFWKDVNDNENDLKIKVDSKMFPTAYVNIALFQKYGQDKNDRPLRLYGAVPINVTSSDLKLNLTLETKDEIKPNEKFKVKVINHNKGIVNYTMSIVDEGILQITDYKTPNPYDYFYQKRGLTIQNYDNYSDIIGLTRGKIHKVLTPGGGTFAANALRSAKLNELGLKKSNRFKPLSIFTGIRTIAGNGTDEVEVNMPNYNGQIRVMVTGASDKKYGEAHKNVLVKSDVIANLSMPRVLHTGDKFMVPVNVFALNKDLDNEKLTFNFMGKTQEKIVSMKKGENKKVYFDVDVKNSVGTYKATVKIGRDIDTIDIQVASNSPYTRINEVKYLKDGSLELQTPGDAISSTVSGDLVISNNPILAIDNRIDEMITYPFGCLEQIISCSMPQLYIENLSTSQNYDREEIVKNINATIEKLKNYQITSGGFAYWPHGYELSYWASIYAGQFLNIAKEKGYYVPDSLYEDWVSFAYALAIENNLNSNLKAYTLYVLSKTNEMPISELNYVYNNDFEKIGTLSKWLVAGAYYNIGEEEFARKIAKTLPKTSEKRAGDEVYSFESPYRDKAMILDIYNKIFKEPDMKLYKEVLTKLQGNDYMSTQDIGYSMLALGNIKRVANKGELNADVIINGKKIKISDEKGFTKFNISGNTKDIKVIGEKLFVNMNWQGIPVNFKQENEDINMSLVRNFYAQDGTKLDPKKLHVGDVFYMEIGVKPHHARTYVYNVALTQIMPSGWEIENTPLPKWAKNKTKRTRIDYRDNRDDRVNIFYTLSGDQTFIIKLNAVTKGEFTLPATQSFGMYNDNIKAYLNGFKVKVE